VYDLHWMFRCDTKDFLSYFALLLLIIIITIIIIFFLIKIFTIGSKDPEG